MKKKVITLLLSLVLASGSIGNVQVLAADTTGQEAEFEQEEETYEQEEEPVQEEVLTEEANRENASEDISETEEEEEPVQEYEDFETEKAIVEEFDTSEEAADEVSETEETEITDESEDALADVVKSGNCGENATWTLTDTGLLTISGSGAMDNYTTFSTPSYYSDDVRKIVIEDGITTIGENAFLDFYIESVSIPESVTYIGSSAFEGCSRLKSITIPKGITRIEEKTFAYCGSLESISMPENIRSIGDNAFYGCGSLTSITIPNGVTKIGGSVFAYCRSLASITFPDGLTHISYFAFAYCSSLTSITIPESVTYIGSDAFEGCGCLKSITIPDSVTEINGGAFQGCSSLTSIIIPDSVTEIDVCTFEGCSSLTSITLPSDVMKIGWEAFSGCISLTSITIPNSVTWIGTRAFYGCSSLTSIIIPKRISTIESSTFYGCSSLTNITIPNSVNEIEESAFEKCGGLESIVIPDGVTSIGAYAFVDCANLANATLPRNIKTLGKYAFKNCDKLTATVKNKYGLTYCQDNGIPYIDRSAIEMKLESYNGSDIRVIITKRDDASGYQIKYADNSSMTDAKSVMLKGSDNLSKVISGLKNDKTYCVKVQSYQTINGTTYWSNWSSAKSIKVTQTPYKTNVSKLSTYIGSHIKVDWTKTAGASGYHIKYADNSSMTGAKEVMVKGNNTFTKTLTGLKNGKTYYVKIQTYRTVSGKTYWSSWSPAKSIKVDQKPYGSSISKLTNPSSKAMKITWDKVSSSSGYHIQYATNSNMSGAKDITINNKDTLSKTVTGLTKGKTYYVRIQTFRKVSGKTYWSSWSKAKQIKISK